MVFFLISSIALGLLDQLQIFRQLSDRIARAFNRSGATRAVACDISKAFDRVWHAGLLHKLKSYGISGQIFGLMSSFLSNRQLQVVLDGKSSQEYPVNAGVPQGSILGPTLFLLYIIDLPDDVICNIAIYADNTTLYFKCNQASDLWQQLELASELESDLRDTVDWGRKWLVDFNAGKTQLVPFDRSKNTGGIDVRMDGSVLEDKTSFKMLGLTFSSKLDWGSYIVSIAKTASKKIVLTFAAMLCELSSIILCYGNELNYIYSNEFNVNKYGSCTVIIKKVIRKALPYVAHLLLFLVCSPFPHHGKFNRLWVQEPMAKFNVRWG